MRIPHVSIHVTRSVRQAQVQSQKFGRSCRMLLKLDTRRRIIPISPLGPASLRSRPIPHNACKETEVLQPQATCESQSCPRHPYSVPIGPPADIACVQRIRQSWNKYNLFNLAKVNPKVGPARTFFQQKWTAKSHLRGYHGAHIRERDWARMFSRRILSTVDLDPSYLARYDGSEQSAGRGSGKQIDPKSGEGPVNAANFSQTEALRRRLEARRKPVEPHQMRANPGLVYDEPVHKMTPYMQMTFAPLERRLDTAIFRAMFASSTLQARQFCIHGAVTVNGQKVCMR